MPPVHHLPISALQPAHLAAEHIEGGQERLRQHRELGSLGPARYGVLATELHAESHPVALHDGPMGVRSELVAYVGGHPRREGGARWAASSRSEVAWASLSAWYWARNEGIPCRRRRRRTVAGCQPSCWATAASEAEPRSATWSGERSSCWLSVSPRASRTAATRRALQPVRLAISEPGSVAGGMSGGNPEALAGELHGLWRHAELGREGGVGHATQPAVRARCQPGGNPGA